ncbi:MAG: hypothetical protein P4L39_10710 [Humidesulfovibrio sp.]|nr:hypothetical protein [Humidesulfovibrio sp.]
MDHRVSIYLSDDSAELRVSLKPSPGATRFADFLRSTGAQALMLPNGYLPETR